MGSEITGAELELMEYLWEHEDERTFAELLDHFNGEKSKDWCKQTMNTYLARLIKKGLLTKDKNGRKTVYRPCVTRTRYRQMCAEDILEESYGGILSNFLAALTGRDRITERDRESLLDLIEKDEKGR